MVEWAGLRKSGRGMRDGGGEGRREGMRMVCIKWGREGGAGVRERRRKGRREGGQMGRKGVY